jgi:hypothetical protein
MSDEAAQRAAEQRLEGCWEAQDFYDGDYDVVGEQPPEDPSCAPFCGCVTCIVREVLDAAYPHLCPGT